jgi:hypothetical protein
VTTAKLFVPIGMKCLNACICSSPVLVGPVGMRLRST